MLSDEATNNPEITEENKQKRREKGKRRQEEEKEEEHLIPFNFNVETAKENVIKKVASKSTKQKRLEATRLLQIRDKRYEEAKKTTKGPVGYGSSAQHRHSY